MSEEARARRESAEAGGGLAEEVCCGCGGRCGTGLDRSPAAGTGAVAVPSLSSAGEEEWGCRLGCCSPLVVAAGEAAQYGQQACSRAGAAGEECTDAWRRDPGGDGQISGGMRPCARALAGGLSLSLSLSRRSEEHTMCSQQQKRRR